ncbi:MAG: hypothetical protein JRN15_15180 [Nitrososphaerota archaeon]|nr:hypothetical protein [Nitrososphaerota archaeon]
MESLAQIEKREGEGRSTLLIGAGSVKVEDLKQVAVVLNQIFQSVMQKDTDYGIIPGTPKPSLWKPGAELLANYFGLIPGEPQITDESDYRIPYFAYRVKIPFHDRFGCELGFGEAACNTREFKYAYRKIWEGPGFDADKLKLTDDQKKQLVQKKDRYYVHTPSYDIYDYQNTVLKIAKKRAFVDGVSSITGASRIFTQDLGDEEEEQQQRVQQAKQVGSGSAKSTSRQILRYFEVDGKKIEIPVKHPAYDELTESLAVIKSEHHELEYTMKRGKALDGDVIVSIKFENISSEAEKKVVELMGSIASAVEGN